MLNEGDRCGWRYAIHLYVVHKEGAYMYLTRRVTCTQWLYRVITVLAICILSSLATHIVSMEQGIGYLIQNNVSGTRILLIGDALDTKTDNAEWRYSQTVVVPVPEEATTPPQQTTTEKTFKCFYCSLTLPQTEFYNHMETHCAQLTIRCIFPRCHAQFKTRDALKQHYIQQHNGI
jgi:hypothetical protein